MSGFVLSNRARRFEEGLAGFGQLVGGLGRQREQDRIAEEDRRKADEMRQQQLALGRQAQMQNAQQLQQGQMSLENQQAMQGLQSQLTGLNRAPVEAAQQEIGIGGLTKQQSPAPMVDQTALDLQDSILAELSTRQGKPMTVDQLRQARQKEKEDLDFTRQSRELGLAATKLGMDATRENIEGAKLGRKKTKMEIDKIEAEIAKLNRVGPDALTGAITKENEGIWDKLFSGYRKDTDTTKASLGQIRKLRSLVSGTATGASDIATLYTFIRSFDSPNSAVREAEATMGQEAAGALQKILNLRQKYEKGRILPDSVRQEMLQAVETLEADHVQQLGAANGRYGRLAEAAGIDPALVLDQEFMQTIQRPQSQNASGPPAAGPKPGLVEDGYRFKGGNPADPNSWERL